MRLSVLLKQLNRNAAAWFSLLGSRPHFGPASPDTSTTTVLAILAHEYGHVYWYDAFVSPPGGSFDGSRFCGGKFYSPDAWTSIAVPRSRWIAFGEQIETQSHRPNRLPELAGHLARTDFGQAGETLRMILTDKELVSTLANFSPIEDFVESYQLFVLRSANPPLASFTIQIDGLQPFDILRQIVDKQGLKRKLACFGSPAVQR
jgi:hypothetical protein